MAGPRIAFVQDWLTTFRGGEQVLLALHDLFPGAPIYTSIYNPEAVPQFAGATVRTSYLQKIPGAKRRFEVLIPLMPQAFESFDLKGYDIIVSVGNGMSKGVLAHPGQRHVWYCHTPARYLWNLGGDNRNKGRFDSGLREYVSHKMRIWDAVSAQRPDVIVTNSITDQERIRKVYRRDATVVYPPVRTDRFQPQDGSKDYFLSVGQLVAYKRTDLAMAACMAAQQPLVVVGAGPERQKLEKLAAGSPLISFRGRLSDQELAEAYANAKALIFAAEEDFGIVPVEAMSAGVPVIAFGKGGATESVVAGKSGQFFAEQNVGSLVAAIAAFDPETYSPAVVRAQAERFDTVHFQDQMKALILGK